MKLYILLVAVLLLPIRFGAAHAQTTPTLPYHELPSDRLGEFGSTATWAILAAGAVGALYAYEEEDPVATKRALEDSPLDGFLETGNAYGSGWGVGGLGVATLSYGVLAGDQRARHIGGDLVVSFVATTAIVGGLKHAIDRKRPNGGAYSFPSGHTAGAFSSVPVIWNHLGAEAGVSFSVLATMTGLARMEENKHFLSDVVAGAALGIVVGRVISARQTDSGWRCGAGPSGVTLSHAF